MTESMKSGEVEIGGVTNLAVDRMEYLIHIPGEPLELATFIKRLMESEKMSQDKVAQHLRDRGYPITQAHVSRLLSLFTLEPEILALLGEGKMSHTAAVELTKIPKAQRLAMIRRLNGGSLKRVTVKSVQYERDAMVASDDLLNLVESESAVFSPVEVWWRGLSGEQKQEIYIKYGKSC